MSSTVLKNCTVAVRSNAVGIKFFEFKERKVNAHLFVKSEILLGAVLEDQSDCWTGVVVVRRLFESPGQVRVRSVLRSIYVNQYNAEFARRALPTHADHHVGRYWLRASRDAQLARVHAREEIPDCHV